MRNLALRYLFAFLFLSFFSFSAAATVNAASAKAQANGSVPAAAGRQSWDSLVAAAKKEGIVSIYSIWRPQTRLALTEAFKARYGIDVEFSPFSRGADLLAKVETEQRAGLYLADVFGAGSNTFLLVMKPTGVLGQIDPILTLPEVVDGKYWSTGRIPFVDRDKTFIAMVSSLTRNIFYNTDMIKPGEITDYPDVLKPQYRGKIAMNDPTVTGPGQDFLCHLAVNIWDFARTKDYFTQLVVTQQAEIQRDNRLLVESVAKGKYPIGLATDPETMANFLKLGAHMDVVIFKQGVRVTSAAGAFAVPNKLAHPNAARLFVNWLLTKEGQTVFSQGFGNPSLRKDVTTEGFSPVFLPRSGERVFPDSEDFLLHGKEVLDMAKQVMDSANK